MHDSRNTNEEDVQKASIRSRADGKWKHDRFDERSQAPKTRRELLSRYGYDIRSEVILNITAVLRNVDTTFKNELGMRSKVS